MAGLTVAREEQHRLFVLVLQPLDRLLVEDRHVVLELPRRVRVQRHADAVCRLVDLGARGLPRDQRRHLVEVLVLQHVLLRERQREDRVVGNVVPVDQLVHDIIVRLERQHPGHHVDREALIVAQPLGLGQSRDVVEGDRAVFGALRGFLGEVNNCARHRGCLLWLLYIPPQGRGRAFSPRNHPTGRLVA